MSKRNLHPFITTHHVEDTVIRRQGNRRHTDNVLRAVSMETGEQQLLEKSWKYINSAYNK